MFLKALIYKTVDKDNYLINIKQVTFDLPKMFWSSVMRKH